MAEKKISFLFGAGAEAKSKSEEESFGLPSSIDYLHDTFFCRKTDKIINALKQFFSSDNKKEKKLYFNETYSYNASTLMSGANLYKKVLENLLDIKKKEKQNEEIKIQDEDVKCFEKIFNDFLEDKERKEVEVSNELLKKALKVETENNKACLSRTNFESEMQISFGSFLDEYFHTIINPKKYGPVNFSKVFNYYWSCFFSIADSLISSKKIKNKKLQEFFDSDTEINHLKILQNLSDFIRILYKETAIDYKGTYYSEIIKQLKNRKSQYECKGAITTNYFKFVEECFSSFTEVSYINGKLKWFEYPELLEVRDFSDGTPTENEFDTKHIFFPFIFGQSYLKPVVDKKQTEEFHKFGKILDASDILVILGYNINEDDNHVNSFLHNYLTKPEKRLVFVTDKDDKKNVCRKLKAENLSRKIETVQADYEKQTTSEIVENIFQS